MDISSQQSIPISTSTSTPPSQPARPPPSPPLFIPPPPHTSPRIPLRPWWHPPPRNYTPHPGNNAFTVDSHALSSSPRTTTSSPPSRGESLPHYWVRAISYILRIPFRVLIGNISRSNDPVAPPPRADVPLDTTGQRHNPLSTNNASSNSEAHLAAATALAHLRPAVGTTTTQSPFFNYIPQIKKAWKARTPDISWAISTAFFTSAICTMAVIVALAVNWTAEGTYLKIFLIVFVVRKWIMAFLMMDRALYRLPLKLVEPDSDIDDERHNGIAIYMSDLFTWHGYAMLFFGSFYVFFYGSAHYMTEAPVATGVAIALSCMGLVPFFALFTMMLGALFLLYVLYILFVCMIWPFEKCGLSRRRAISRRNGGYQSDGITNTTDLRQIERAIEDVGHDESGGGGFGGTDRIKMTPAMAAIPIVIFRKRVKGVPVAAKVNESLGQLRLDVTNVIEPPDSEMTRGQLGVDDAVGITDALQSVNDDKGDTSVTDGCTGTINSASTAGDVLEASAEKQGPCDLSKHDMDHIDIPQAQGDRPVVISMSSSSNHDDAIIKLSSSLSAQRTSTIPQSHSPTTRSRASTVSFAINAGPLCASMAASPAPSMKTFIPCATLQELEEAEARLYPEITSPAGRANPGHHPRSGRHTPSIGGTVSIDIEGHSANRSQVSQSSKAVKAKRAFESDTNVLEEYCSLADEECAICLCDFEDGDELRHLYCDHLFHRGCVDRWLARHATCPKCKRSI